MLTKNFPQKCETNSQRASNVGSHHAASYTQMPNSHLSPQRKWFRLKPGRFVDEEDSLSQSENNGYVDSLDDENNSSTTETFGGGSEGSSNDDHLFSIG